MINDQNIQNDILVGLGRAATLLDEVFEKFYNSFGLTRVQFFALHLIVMAGEGGITLSELSKSMSVSKPNVTTLIDRMENNGYVKRVQDAKDRRSSKLVVTKEGMDIFDLTQPRKEKFVKDVFSFLTEAELKKANELLQKFENELLIVKDDIK